MGDKIVMCGCGEAGWESIQYLLEQGIRIDHFVSITPEKAEQQKVSGYKSYAGLAEEYNIPIYYAKKYSLKDPADLEFFRENKFDLMIQGGWQRLFPEEVLETLRVGAVGIHGSSEYLPKGRGRSPINWSLIEGKQRFIFHYFLIKPGVDDGDVFHHEIADINAWDDCRTVYYKNAIITKRAYLEWIPRLLKGDYTVKYQEGEPSYYPKRTPEDGRIDWSKSMEELHNFIRAITHPYPGAFTYRQEQKINLWKAQPFDQRIDYPEAANGEVVEVFSTGDAVIKCRDGLLLITEYEGKLEVGAQLI